MPWQTQRDNCKKNSIQKNTGIKKITHVILHYY